ncbi:MAG: hypothetical protein ABL921_16200, partial [Pirellula sp.]
LIMNNKHTYFLLTFIVGWLAASTASAAIITNGGFEAGLTGWTAVNQVGGEGSFSLQTGTSSPIFGEVVQAPPEGIRAAMSDAGGPASHVLYQDFVVPAFAPGESAFVFTASLYVGNRADRFATPSSLQFDLPDPGAAGFNQRARIDITLAGATNPFTLAPSDVIFNVFETAVGSALVSGYTPVNINLTTALAGRTGQTLRLRFAEVDNLGPFQFGVDRIDITAVPEPSAAVLMVAVLMVMTCLLGTYRVARFRFVWKRFA